MSDETAFRAAAREMIEAHGERVLTLARMQGHGLQFVPSTRWMKYVAGSARESVEHFEIVSNAYHLVSSGHFDAAVSARMRASPVEYARGYDELAVALLVLGRAWWWQLREHDGCALLGYREVAMRLGHEVAARQVLQEQMVAEVVRAADADALRGHVAHWIDVARASFGRPGTPGVAYAIGVGLRRRDVSAALRDFLLDVRGVLLGCGLDVPLDGAREASSATGT